MSQTPSNFRQQRGQAAENLACQYLEQQGLELITRNYRSKSGEIDLIMREGKTTVFVEVRLRSNPGFGSGAESVDKRKQAKLTATALYYLQQNAHLQKRPARFDVISITGRDPIQLDNWIKDAFQGS